MSGNKRYEVSRESVPVKLRIFISGDFGYKIRKSCEWLVVLRFRGSAREMNDLLIVVGRECLCLCLLLIFDDS